MVKEHSQQKLYNVESLLPKTKVAGDISDNQQPC